jgi:hypothetical protein
VKQYCNQHCTEKAERIANAMFSAYGAEDAEADGIDALTDLMHLAHSEKWDFEAMLATAAGHFQAEMNGEQYAE